jgi:hypothetical protein
VCSVNYEPIAGHRANIPFVKYLSEGREMEIALAPIAGTHLLAPFRLSVVSTLANFMIESNRFETIMVPAPEGVPSNVTHPFDNSPARGDGVVERREGSDPEQDQRQSRSDGVVERCVRVGPDLVRCQEVRKSGPESDKPAPGPALTPQRHAKRPPAAESWRVISYRPTSRTAH